MGYEQEHVPVLLEEVLFWIHPTAGGRYVDCTLGTGKTALSILRQSDSPSYLLGIDRDPKALFGDLGQEIGTGAIIDRQFGIRLHQRHG